MITLGVFFQNLAFRILGAAMGCCQVAVWLFVAGATIHRGFAGELFHPPCLAPLASEEGLSSKASGLERRLSGMPTLPIVQTPGFTHSSGRSFCTPFADNSMGRQLVVGPSMSIGPQQQQLLLTAMGQQPMLAPSSCERQLQQGGPSRSGSLPPLPEGRQRDRSTQRMQGKDLCRVASA